MPTTEDRGIAEAQTLRQRGDPEGAARLCRRLLGKNPRSAHALHLLGVIEAEAGRVASARPLLLRSLAAHPPHIGMFETCAAILLRAGDLDTAADVCRRGLDVDTGHMPLLHMAALAAWRGGRLADAVSHYNRLITAHPTLVGALNERGALLTALHRHAEALADFERVRALAPQRPEAHMNLGTAYAACGRHADALAAYDAALAAAPGLADAWLGRGSALAELDRADEAAAAFERALEHRPDCADAWVGIGALAHQRAHHEDALAAFERAAALAPDCVEARLGLANALAELQRFAEAGAAFDAVLALAPDSAEAWLGLGNLAWALSDHGGALAFYEKAATLRPRFVEAWLGRANCLDALLQHEEAVTALDEVLALAPDRPGVASDRFRLRMRLCDWTDYHADCARLVASVRNGEVVVPYALLCAAVSSTDQRACAERWAAHVAPACRPSQPMRPRAPQDAPTIRLAYLSADFRAHATGSLTAGLFEHHDRSRFEITALSVGPDDGSDMRRRIAAAFDRFVDAQAMSDPQITALAQDLGIDILIDLKGFTREGRPGVLARRAAPVQVAYLGYPMTMGAAYVDYVIADRVVVPAHDRDAFAEKIVTLPHSYQINDRARTIADVPATRAASGLPPDGVVFCCFNNTFKISPPVFDRWMRILHATADSVLWLLADTARSSENLRREATARGVDPARLVFADRVPHPEHLARQRLADLFLDTLPCNAHTTASDALWAGLPVLTCAGETFAGRVAASLLQAIGLPDLIAATMDDYEARAIAIAADPAARAGLKSRLDANRLTTPLFDTARTARAIEAAFTAMWERHRAGLAPDHIDVGDPIAASSQKGDPAA